MAATMLKDSAGHVQLTDEQFNRIVDLLTPGYELSKLMLAQYQEAHPQAEGEAGKPAEETNETAGS